MNRVCEEHLSLDLARIDLRPGATRRLPRIHAHDLEWQPHAFGGYVRGYGLRWVSAAYACNGDTVRVSVSEGAKDRTVHRSTHVLSLIEAPNVVGGTRTWFDCPCCRRYARVMFYRGGSFRCRVCAGLKHRSTVTFKTQRKESRLAEISRALNGSGKIFDPLPIGRPKYMRKAREAALRAEHARLRTDLGMTSTPPMHIPAPGVMANMIKVARSLGWTG